MYPSFQICPPKLISVVEGGTYYYDMVISTGVWKHSATTANITISIKGDNNEQSQIPLREKGDTSQFFGRGSINGFVLVMAETIGTLKEITLDTIVWVIIRLGLWRLWSLKTGRRKKGGCSPLIDGLRWRKATVK